MNLHHGRDSARPQEPVMPVILGGGPWKARRIRNNCLRQHCHVLATTFRRRDGGGAPALKAACARVFTVLETRSRILTDLHPNELAVVAAVARLGAYADQWLRQPEDWRPDPEAGARLQWAGLLRHLLARYSVPAYMDRVWELPGQLIHFERDCWCAMGYGRSLQLVDGFPKSVSNRVLHAAVSGNEGEGLIQAVWLAQLRLLGASWALKRAVMSSRVVAMMGDHAQWVRLTEKFAAGSGGGDVVAARFGMVVESLVAVREHRGAAQAEALMRLPLEILISHCLNFGASLLQARGHLLSEQQLLAVANAHQVRLAAMRWPPLLGAHPFDSRYGRAHGRVTWLVQELCSARELQQEGAALSHCVAGYAQRCRNGSSAIFSVRHCRTHPNGGTEMASCATIEVRSRTRKIVQIRAYKNRPVNNTITNIVHEWAAAHRIEVQH